MQSVLASFLPGRRARLEVSSDTYEVVETMLLQLSHCWHRRQRSQLTESGQSGATPAGQVLEALPMETENRLLEHLRELASRARQGRRSTTPALVEQTSALFWHWQHVLCRLLPFPWLEPDVLVHRSLLELVPALISMDASIRQTGVCVARQMPPSWLGQSTVWCLALTLACHDRNRDVAANARQLIQKPVHDIARLASWLGHVYAPIRQAAAEAIAEAVAKAPDSASMLRQWLPVWFARFPKFTGLDTKTANEGSYVRQSDSATTTPDLDWADGLSHVLLALAQRGERLVTVELSPMIFAFFCARGWTCADTVIRQRLRRAAVCFIEYQGSAAVPVLLSLLTSALENPPDDLEVSLQDIRQESLILVLGALALHIPSNELAVLCQAADRLVRMALATPAADVQQAAADVLVQLIPRWNQVDPKAVEERLDNWLNIALGSSEYGQRRGAALLWAAALYAIGGASVWNGSVAAQRVTDILSDRNAPLEARLGALALLEALALRLQSAYEPIGVQMLPLLLQASGDNMTSVRQSSADAARALMRYLSAAEMPTVLHSLLEQLDNGSTSWRTRMASLDMLGSMANMGPEQLARALPEIVPRLVSALTDVHPRVQETAAQALSQMAELATQPAYTAAADDVEAAADQIALARSLSKRLVQALGQPEQHLLPVLHELRQSLQQTLLVIGDVGNTSTQLLDALLLPLLRRALSHRQLAVRQEALAVLLERTRTRDRGLDRPTAVPGIPPGSLILARLKEDLVSMILRDSIPEHRYRAALVLRELMRPLLSNSMERFWSSLPSENKFTNGSSWSASSVSGHPAETSLWSLAAPASTNMNTADESQLSMELWNRLIVELFAERNGPTERSGAAEAIASLASLHWQRTRAETPTTPYGEIDPAIDRLLRTLIWDVLEPSAGLETSSSVSRESALLVVGSLARHEIPLYEHKSLWQAVLDASRDVQDAVRQAALGAGEALIDASKRQIHRTCAARNGMEVVSRTGVPSSERRDRANGAPAQTDLLQCWFAAPCWQALEEGLVARHWRVRLACIQLGESALRRQELSDPLSGASGAGTTLNAPMSQESRGDERLILAPLMETGRGPARADASDGLAFADPGEVLYQFRPIFLARLYILRFDLSASIQSHASTLWKKWVPNAARTLHVLAPQVRKEALACLRGLDNATDASVDGDLVLATQGALEDLCSKLGADVAAEVISELQTLVGNDGAAHGTECANRSRKGFGTDWSGATTRST
ncbi:GCN1 proteinral control of amino-acid synthesis 1-like 1 [Cyanidiococcus yangmingshanensis]|uniref:GCN1 proteinral control of amino-acid synthesis 1-like 1 n=1 Tax=Cyanidiococcus yangmingshanensis TaxID=2690220 RepID=A0A7J7IFN8_9RHOD|nr:GCN1 proteinral control of amino-acid synthesis 1-like 1 [Cyanidiococcus yangmingshanensis]